MRWTAVVLALLWIELQVSPVSTCFDEVSEGSLSVVWGYRGAVFGPEAGGTLILVRSSRDDLDTLRASGARLVLTGSDPPEELNCPLSTNSQNNATYHGFMTPRSVAGREYNIQMRCGDVVRDLGRSFQYRPNPTLDPVQDPRTIVKGGIRMKFRGENLMSVGFPQILIYQQYNGTISPRSCHSSLENHWCRQICRLQNDTDMFCISPDMYTVIPAEVGGGWLSGRDTSPPSVPFTFSQPPGLQLANKETELRPYIIFLFETEIGDHPTLPGRRQKQVQIQRPGEFLNSHSDYDVFVRVLLDGTTLQEPLHQLLVAANPIFYDLGQKDFNPEFPNNDKFLTIKGDHISSAAQREDITVTVGNDICPLVSEPTINAIICEPPTDPKGGKTDKGYHVVVRVGYYHDSVGHINYVRWYESWHFIVIVVSIVALILIVVLLYCGITRTRCFRDPKEYPFIEQSVHSNQYDVDVLSKLGSEIRARVRDAGLLYPETVKIKIANRLGSGNFGVVYRGFVQAETGYEQEVAVKTLKGTRQFDDEQMKGFFKEALFMKEMDHENILNIMGVVILNNQPHIVMPYMHNGDLKTFLSKEDKKFPVTDLVDYAIQIANGMAYMQNRSVVHRDLAARNCMVSENERILISDFGMARDLEVEYRRIYKQSKRSGVPVRWMSPESLKDLKFDSHSDVWSFGVVIWELFNRGGKPYGRRTDAEIQLLLEMGERLEKPRSASPEIYNIMMKCWTYTPEDRPSFVVLVGMLQEALNSIDELGDKAPYMYVDVALPTTPSTSVSTYPADTGDYLHPSGAYTEPYSQFIKPRESMPPGMAPNPQDHQHHFAPNGYFGRA